MALRPRKTFSRTFGNKLVTAPAVEPVTLDEAKEHMRITNNDSDGFIEALITEARQMLESISSVNFITQTWVLTIDNWPGAKDAWWGGIREGAISDLFGGYASVALPRYPLQSISGINVYDEAGNATAVTVADVFDVDTESRRGKIVLKSNAAWPVALRPSNAIKVTYVAGYGDAASDVPAALKRAVRSMVAYMFEHRGTCGMNQAYNDSGARQIMALYRDVEI
jgi:hypothetical protein